MIFFGNLLFNTSVVLSIALLATCVFRRQSASMRHGILAAAIVSTALLPGLMLLLPT